MFRSDDGSLPETDILVEWSKKFQDIGENHTKKTFRIAERCKRYIEDAGFINVVEKKYKVPVGPWSSDPLMKEIGRWNLMHCFTGAEAWALHLLTMVLNVRVSPFSGLLTATVDPRRDQAVYPQVQEQPAQPGAPRLL